MKKRTIGIELRALNNLIMRHMENQPVKKELDKATATNGWIIGYIAKNSNRDVFQRDLEEEFSITRSTASKVINLMVQKGFVERQCVSSDARLKKLILTEKAKEFSKKIQPEVEKMESKLLEGFTEEEIETVHSFIMRMKNNMK